MSSQYLLDHVHLFMKDAPAAAAWLETRLGATPVSDREVRGARYIDVDLGGVKISIRSEHDDETFLDRQDGSIGYDHLCLVVADISVAADELRAQGVVFVTEPFEARPGVHGALIRGPEGVRIELVQRD